jgi:23S rRNA (uracil1939-C5)-methyltransferase
VESDDRIRRHPEAFFQANRFLVGPLVSAVIDSVLSGPVLDLYAGVGLFSVALAASGRAELHAVEGDPVSGRDLLRNAAAYHDQLRVSRSSVEAFLARPRSLAVGTLIVDPPRTGMSKEAVEAVAKAGAERIVYVSCDPPTMARDSRRLVDAGYRLRALKGFDLFPNTPHVETLGVFER